MNFFRKIGIVSREFYTLLKSRYYAEVSRLNYIDKGLYIEKPFSINGGKNLLFTSPVYIGPNSQLQLIEKLIIGKGTIIGPRLTVLTANHKYEGDLIPYSKEYICKPVNIGEYVWIGENVTLLPGISIGAGAVIGAGTVVSKDVPPCAVVVGNPAKIVKYRDKKAFYDNMNNGRGYLSFKFQNKL